ncbi:MAG: alpha/beta hydrolase, partial [Betaproteobacteria bacterium]|nr:alpha/beta hydrolase [Betaproteobacteria bacterium]
FFGSLALLVLVFFLGPTNEFGPDTPSARPSPPDNTLALDDWLQASEAAWTDIKPGAAKGIVWADDNKQRTEWAVVYLHGFSASRLETTPVADQVAKQLGANLFYTRLTGHGRSGPAMAEAFAQDWMADTLEAVRIGKTLGRKVLVISCSTGSTLSTWLGTSPESGMVDAHVFISPNFGLKDKRSELINGHWGQRIAYAVTGDIIQYTSDNPRDAQGWTQSYPTKALFPMLALVKKVRESDLSQFKTPVLVLFSEADQTVDPEEVKHAFAKFGSSHKLLEPVAYSQSKGQHVLAGDIRDPQAVAPMVKQITDWVRTQ